MPARLFDLKANHISDIMTEVLSAKYIAVGSPTLNNSMMPTVAAFLCYLKGLSPKNRIGIPFGSYGWGQTGPKEVAESLEKCGFSLDFGTLTRQWTEDEQGLCGARPRHHRRNSRDARLTCPEHRRYLRVATMLAFR